MSEQPVHVERSEVHASDADAAEALLKSTYIDFRPRRSGVVDGPGRSGTERLSLQTRRTAAGELMLDRIMVAMGMRVVSEPFQRLMFFFPLSGSLEVRSRDLETQMQPGDAIMYPIGVPLEVDWEPLRTELLSVPLEVAERAAGEEGSRRPLRFVGTTPVSATADRLWRSTVGFVVSQLESTKDPLSCPVAQARALDLIASAALKTFPNTAMFQDYLPGPGQVAPSGLRRAVDYIETSAHLPVTLADVAKAASTSPPALQHAFEMHYGLGPMEYLRRARLERAHLDLLLADPTSDATVSAIATSWGFLSPGRFSAAYRDTYGQLPDETLRVGL